MHLARDDETWLAKGQEKIGFYRTCEVEETYFKDKNIC